MANFVEFQHSTAIIVNWNPIAKCQSPLCPSPYPITESDGVMVSDAFLDATHL